MTALRRRRGPTGVLAGLVATTTAVSLSAVAPARADRWQVESSASARVTATDNAGLGLGTAGRDLVTDVGAGLGIRHEGARISLIGNIFVEGFLYANHTQSNSILANVDLLGRWVAVEQFLFVDASIRTTQNYIDPYGPGLTSTTTANNTTTTQYRLAPYIESRPSTNLHFRARSDNVMTYNYGSNSPTTSAVDGSYFGLQTISLERDPVPLGWRLEGVEEQTRYQGQFLPLVSDFARAIGNMAIVSSTVVGLRVGVERHNYLPDTGWTAIYGGQASWRPSERTTFSFDGEHQYWGNAVHLVFTHRMPFFSWDLRASRDVDTTPRTLFNLPPTDNVAALLDSILTTRFPNPADRANEVQNIISREGLPASSSTFISIAAPRLSVTELASLGLAYLGVRNTLALTLSASRISDALQDGALATGNAAVNNFQHGAALSYALRMTPTATAGLTFTWSGIRSLDTASSTASTKDTALRGQVAIQLAPKTSVLLGAEQRRLESSVATSGRETSVYVALGHRF